MRAVVTGGAGFFGGHVWERLLAEGAEVLCVGNYLTGAPANVAHLLDEGRFHLLRRYVTEYLHVPGRVDAVLHFASPASPVRLSPAADRDAEGQLGRHPAHPRAGQGARLCDSSSPIVFVPRPEDDPTVRQPDITLARTTLAWEPQVPVEEGLRRSIAWFCADRLRHAGEPAPTGRICAPSGRRS